MKPRLQREGREGEARGDEQRAKRGNVPLCVQARALRRVRALRRTSMCAGACVSVAVSVRALPIHA